MVKMVSFMYILLQFKKQTKTTGPYDLGTAEDISFTIFKTHFKVKFCC